MDPVSGRIIVGGVTTGILPGITTGYADSDGVVLVFDRDGSLVHSVQFGFPGLDTNLRGLAIVGDGVYLSGNAQNSSSIAWAAKMNLNAVIGPPTTVGQSPFC